MIDQPTKSHTSSPTLDTNKKPLLRDASPVPVTPISLSPATVIPHESVPSTTLPLTSIHSQRLSRSEENAPGIASISSQSIVSILVCLSEMKSSEAPSLLHSISTISKGSNDNELTPSNLNKRPHLDEPAESIYTSEVDEQLSPSKRVRRSISSQESFETFRSLLFLIVHPLANHLFLTAVIHYPMLI